MAFSIVLISFREWLHSYGEAMDKQQLLKLIQFSSLSESGFIPTAIIRAIAVGSARKFSSLSESGFIPTQWHNDSQRVFR